MPKQYTDCWAHKQKLSYMQGTLKLIILSYNLVTIYIDNTMGNLQETIN